MRFNRAQLWADVDAFVREFGSDERACEMLARTQPKFAELLPYSFELMLPYQKRALESPKNKRLMMGGRGIGKTRTGVQWLRKYLYSAVSHAPILLTTPTHSNLMDAIVHGPSGVMRMFPEHERPTYDSQKGLLTFSWTPIRINCRVAENAINIRGISAQAWWWDEIAGCSEKQAFIGSDSVYGAALHALREGERIPWFFTTTPKPWAGLRKLVADPRFEIVRATSFENTTLTSEFVANISQDKCSRDARQETYGELLDDGGTYVKQSTINASRRHCELDDLDVVIAIDPAATSDEESDETGIIIAGVSRVDGHAYVLEDCSGHYAPSEWATLIVNKWDHYAGICNTCYVVAETNQGGEMVEATLRSSIGTQRLPLKTVHAKRGKQLRLSPCIAQLETNNVHFPVNPMHELEYQLTTFTGESGKRDDRVDAFAYAITELLLTQHGVERHIPNRSY